MAPAAGTEASRGGGGHDAEATQSPAGGGVQSPERLAGHRVHEAEGEDAEALVVGREGRPEAVPTGISRVR